jgi:hypothetical protein
MAWDPEAQITRGENVMKKVAMYLTCLVVFGVTQFSTAGQALPGKHPGYLHALTDLRTARWLLSHQPGDAKVYASEDVAITEINAAIAEIKRASIDDGKDLNDHPAVDVMEHGSRLLRSIESLDKAKEDIDHEEDNPEVRELRNRAAEHIHRATDAAKRAHEEWVKDGKP